MLDYSSPDIEKLVLSRGWRDMPPFDRIRAIYDFVRDEILFGYNTDDSIPASKVLADGYGQCNTKGTLFMAVLRSCSVPCRVHGFTIDKKLQKGAMTGFVYRTGAFCGFGVAVKDFSSPVIDFARNNTYIQSEGINQDFGVYDCPDDLLREHHQELSPLKAFAYRHLGRHLMNRNVKRIRKG